MLKKLSFSSSIKDGDSSNTHPVNASSPSSTSTKFGSGKLGPSRSHIHDCKLTEVSVISNSKCTTSSSKIEARTCSTTGGTTKVQSSINGQRACNNSPVIARPGATVDTVSTRTETGYTSEACTAKSSANTESSSRVNIPLPTLGSANQPSLAKPTTAFTSLTTSVSSTSSANPIEARNSPIETISSKVTPGTIVHHHHHQHHQQQQQSKHSTASLASVQQSHLHSKSSSARSECTPRHGVAGASTGKSLVTTASSTAAASSESTTTTAAASTATPAATTTARATGGNATMSTVAASSVTCQENELSKKQREQRRKEIKREFAKNWETATSANLDKSGCNMSFVFDPSGRLIYYWSMIVSLAFVYNAWVIMYRFAFDEINETSVTLWMPLDGLADLIYLCDILINFRIGYLEEGVLQTDGAKLRQHYMNTTLFYVDCLCLLPLDFLYLSIGFNSMLRCFRLVKIYRFWSFLDRTERHTNYPNVFRTVSLLHYILVLFHWNACLYELISKRGGFGSHDWFGGSRLEECPDVDCDYLHAFYWSTLALTTIGDLPRPRTKGEYVFLIIELLMGLFLLATVLGHVANIVTNVSAARSSFQAKLDAVKTYMRMRRVPEHLKVKVIKWFDYLWSTQKTADEEKSVGFLPAKLKAEIAIHVHLDTLKRVEIFQNTEAGFLCALVLRLQPVLFSPQDYVCRKGEIGKEMYIVNRGKLQVVADNGKTVLATLRAGSYFGEISILNMGPAGNRRTASVRSVGYSDLFCLSKNDMWDVLKDYPAARVRLEAIAVKRLEKYRKEPFKKISMGRSRSTPGLVESKSNLNIVTGATGTSKGESKREKRSAVHLTPSPVGHSHHHQPTSSASVANLISSSDDQVGEKHCLDQKKANANESNSTLHHHQQQSRQSPSTSTSVHPVTYGESGGDSGGGSLLPPPPTYTSVQVSQSHTGPPGSLTVSQVAAAGGGHSITNTTPTLGLTLATPTYPSSVPICSSYLFASASQYEPKSPLYHYTTSSSHAVDRRPSTPSPIDLIGITIAPGVSGGGGGSSSSTVESPCLETNSAFKPMSPALSAPHLQSAILPSMYPLSPIMSQALAPGGGGGIIAASSSSASVTSSAIPLSRTPVPGEMSQELLILEIKRLRERLQTLECENAAMTSKLNQQSWEVCNRLAEIEFQISTNSGGVGGSSTIGPTGSSTFQSTSCNITDRSTDVSIDLTRHAIQQQQQQPPPPPPAGYSSTTSGTATVSPSGSSSGSVTCDESERNRESVI